jgi:hypothetical protein
MCCSSCSSESNSTVGFSDFLVAAVIQNQASVNQELGRKGGGIAQLLQERIDLLAGQLT